MTKVYSLKSGKTYTAPSLFIYLQSQLDVTSLWYMDEKNKLTNIDGFYLSFVNYDQIYKKLKFNTKPLFNTNRITIRDKILLLDPSIDKLLTGMDADKQKMFATGKFDRRIEKIMKEIQLSGLTPIQKSQRTIDEIYSKLQVRSMIELQTESNVDIIISPCIPITSKINLTNRFNFARQMLLDTKTLLETSSLKRYKETKDLMNVLTLSGSVIADERNFHALFDLLLCNNPDHVGIKIDRMEESDTVRQIILFKFFREFHKYAKHKTENNVPPMHWINVNELGYVGYCNAVSNIICPIGRFPSYPYRRKVRGGNTTSVEIDTSMNYYHPINMDYPKFKSQNPFPCACGVCEKHRNAYNVPNKERPLHNRKHWLEVKDGEIREFRETPAMLNIALRDKFARSTRTQLIAYIPNEPTFVHNSAHSLRG